jgi:hypothetical protein
MRAKSDELLRKNKSLHIRIKVRDRLVGYLLIVA